MKKTEKIISPQGYYHILKLSSTVLQKCIDCKINDCIAFVLYEFGNVLSIKSTFIMVHIVVMMF